MPNQLGTSVVLNDANGIFSTGPARVLGICIKSALAGNLTITGVTQSSGSPQSWVISSGTSGFVAAPGSGQSGGGNLSFSYANAGDYGQAIGLLIPA